MQNSQENNNKKKILTKVLITGGSGFIGDRLCAEFVKDNYQLTILTRNKQLKNNSLISYIYDLDSIDFNFDIIINLAGSTIATNWGEKNKKEIYESRINITKKIVEKINSCKNPPQVFISGSAIGIYGNQAQFGVGEDCVINLDDNNFSQKLCYDWENQALQSQNKTRVVILRTGIVLGNNKCDLKGFLKKIYLPFLLGAGAKIGDGKQLMSWIDINDVVEIIKFIINNQQISNVINLVSPKSLSNAEFSNIFASILNRPCLLQFPEFFIKKIYGKMGEELMLASQNIYPKKLLENNYKFQFIEIEKSLNNIFIK